MNAPVPSSRTGRRVVVATWAYAALVLACLILIRRVGESWWPVTVLVFLPRWLFLLPALALVLAAGRCWRRRLWVVQGATVLLILGPVMAPSLPVHRLRAADPRGLRLRIMTLNRGMAGLDAPRLIRLIERERIDVICFQEGRSDPALKDYWARGWSRTTFLASRLPIVGGPDRRLLDDPDCPYPEWRTRLERVRIRAPSGVEFAVASVHLDTVRHGLMMLRSGDAAGLERHSAWRGAELRRVVAVLSADRSIPVLVGGDFNFPSDSPAFAPARRHFRVGFDEAGWGYGYTYPSRLPWIRIDHILASPHWSVVRCWVGPDVGSDHFPLIAEVVLTDPPQPVRHAKDPNGGG